MRINNKLTDYLVAKQSKSNLQIPKQTLKFSLVTSLVFAAVTSQAGTNVYLNAGAVDFSTPKEMYSLEASSTETKSFILQFNNSIQSLDRKVLQQKQISILGYLPVDALVVRATVPQMQDLVQSLKSVRGFGIYRSEYKLSPSLGATTLSQISSAVTIKLFKSSEAQQAAAQVAALGGQIRVIDSDNIEAIVPRAQLRNIAALKEIEHIQASKKMIPLHMELMADDESIGASADGDYSDFTGFETGTKILGMDAVWAAGYAGRGQIGSMADTGLDMGSVTSVSDDFKGAVISGHHFGFYAKDWSDPMGHGTHVAGSMVGRGVFSSGKFLGAAYQSQFVAQGMWSPMLNNLGVPAKLGKMFDAAKADGAVVHNNSWGSPRDLGAYDNFANQVDTWSYENPEMLLVFAAGNSGVDRDKDGRIDAGSIGSPGTAKNVLTVGASENVVSKGGIQVPVSKLKIAKDNWPAEPIFSSMLSDHANGVAVFSSRGPTKDGRLKPEVVAPGTNISSTRSHAKGAEDLWGKYNDHYVYSGGTSMASPLAAGAALVARQILIEKYKVQNPSAVLLKAVLMHTADEMFPGQYGSGGAAAGQEILTLRPNSDEGYGRVDAKNFLNLDKTLLIDEKTGVAQGAEKVFEVEVNNGGLLANLVWVDPPASPNASIALVNDLDMVVYGPGGKLVSSSNDHTNNNEIFESKQLPSGRYKIVVKGNKLPVTKTGTQGFALVVSAN